MIGVRFSESKCCRNFQCKKVLWLSMLLLTSFIVGCEDQERNNVTWGWGALVERYSFLSDFPAYDGGIAKYDYQEVEDSVLLYVVLDYVDKPFVVAYFKKLEDSGFEMKSDLRIYKKYKENQNYKLIVEVDIMSITFKKIPLTKEPPMDQSDELALSTFEGIDGATAGNYRAVISWYGASFPLKFDVMCGNGMVGPVNTGRMRQEPAWNYTSTSTMGLWSSAYSAILGCNKALTAINEGKFSRNGVSDEQINNIKAENLFLRALAYFDLVRVYAQPYGYIKANGITGVEAMGVPIVLKDDLSARPSRNTVAEVYENLIIPDLVEAERLMSDSYVRAGVKDVVATVTKPVIQALMARVYLHHEDWQLAADYATKVIKNGRFRLLSGDRFVSMWDGSVRVFACFKMPKATDEEKAARSAAIQEATKFAALVPMQVARNAYELMTVIMDVARLGNRNAVTDACVAMMSARSAVLGALMNVRINLGSLKDKEFVAKLQAEACELERLACAKEKELLDEINEELKV